MWYLPAHQVQTKDIEKFWGVNYKRGQLVSNWRQEINHWCTYFEPITEEFLHLWIPHTTPAFGPAQLIAQEFTETLKQMKPNKAMSPDDIAAVDWKSHYWNPVDWLTTSSTCSLLSRSYLLTSNNPNQEKEEKQPCWLCKLLLIWLLYLMMKIFERILNIVQFTTNQALQIDAVQTTCSRSRSHWT